MKFVNLFLIHFLLLNFLNCGDYSVRKSPFRIAFSNYENRSAKPVILSRGEDNCSIFFHKRIYNILYFIPLNGFNSEEISKISNIDSIRYKNVMLIGDILFTSLLFLITMSAYSVEIEKCESPFKVVLKENSDNLDISASKEKEGNLKQKEDLISIQNELKNKNEELEKLKIEMKKKGDKESNPDSSKEIDTFVTQKDITPPKKEIDFPLLANYEKFLHMPTHKDVNDYIIFFNKDNDEIPISEKNKIDNFILKFKERREGYKILLMGHANWNGYKKNNIQLSLNRIKKIKDYIISIGIRENKIYTIASSDKWQTDAEEENARKFNQRVDMLLME